jgi:hypothetical protein
MTSVTKCPTRVEEAIASRYAAGESVIELASDYETTEGFVVTAIRAVVGYLLDESDDVRQERDALVEQLKGMVELNHNLRAVIAESRKGKAP